MIVHGDSDVRLCTASAGSTEVWGAQRSVTEDSEECRDASKFPKKGKHFVCQLGLKPQAEPSATQIEPSQVTPSRLKST